MSLYDRCLSKADNDCTYRCFVERIGNLLLDYFSMDEFDIHIVKTPLDVLFKYVIN